MNEYNDQFFETRARRARADARQLAPEVRLAIGFLPESVADFGCGDGSLLQCWRAMGVLELTGIDPNGPDDWRGKTIDGDPVDPSGQHIRHDLAEPVMLQKRVDLATCIEVAEHIQQDRAGVLVDSLCGASDRVLFSAAHPGQGGHGHVNEQPLIYWVRLFKSRGYVMQDIVRKRLAPGVSWWLRSNVVLFSKIGKEVRHPKHCVLIPTYDGTMTEEVSAISAHARGRGWRVIGSAVDKSRVELFDLFLRQSDYEMALCLDSDMKPSVRETEDLMTACHMSKREVLSGMYARKDLPIRLAHATFPGQQIILGDLAPQQPFANVGFGCVVVTRAALERVIAWSRRNPQHPWAVQMTAYAGNAANGNKLGWDFFRPILGDPDPSRMDLDTGRFARPYYSEDQSFCMRFREAGGTVWVMPQVWPGHVGTFVYGQEQLPKSGATL